MNNLFFNYLLNLINSRMLFKYLFALCLILQLGVSLGLQQTSIESSVELMTWGKDTIIHRGRKDIYLSHYSPQNSVVVLMVNDVPWTQSDLPILSGEFTVHAPKGQGLIAVLQVINLRRNPMDFSCIDYLQFYDPLSAVGSSKICGTLSKENKEFLPMEMLGPRVFHSPSGIMQVQYKSEKGNPSSSSPNDISFHMIEVVFTAYRDCDLNDDSDSQRKCGDQCISSILFCDERINCGFEEDFAVDEGPSCGESYSSSEGHLFTRYANLYWVYITLIAATLILILLIVSICYHYKRTYKRIQNIPQ